MEALGIGSFTGTGLADNVTVGKYSSIASNVHFHNNSQHICKYNKKCVFTTNWFQPEYGHPIRIGNDAWIGEGARILENIVIEDGAIIGAGAVITQNVPPYAVVVGNPQRIVRFRFSEDRVARLLKMKWWDWKEEVILERKQDMQDIDLFLQKYGS